MEFNKNLSDKILKKRNIKTTSLNAYILNLQKILKMMELEPTISNLDKALKNPKEIMDLLKDKKPSTIRNYLAAIVVYLSIDEDDKDTLDEYRALMELYQKQNNDAIKNNTKTSSQEKNWSTLEELRQVLKNYKKELDMNGSLKKDELSKKEFDLLQKWVVGNLYIGDDANPPLRNDYIMEVVSFNDYKDLSDSEKKRQNYLVIKNRSNKFFSLGEYKTSDKFGIKLIKVGKTLNKVLNVWLKYNKSGHLLLNSKGEPISPNSLTKLLVKTFSPTGKNISSSMLRHIFITEKFPPNTTEKQEVADKMLHSKEMQSDYAKQ
tara:strand:+ start:783 stop:1742 length:960 start_codon:yes stop_codon:yes gene_type:complete